LIRKRPTKNQRSPGPWPGLLGLAVACLTALRASAAPSSGLRLAAELAEEESWRNCLVECRRVLAVDPDDAEAAALESRASSALSRVRGEAARPHRGRVARDLRARADEDARTDGICPRPEVAGHLADPSTVFRRSANGEPPSRTRSLLTAPFRWAIFFYRGQIAPALGRRCSLHPSCSEFTLQAMRKHGLLAIPMYADRAVREPAVVAEAGAPVLVGGRRRYADPLEDHDWWIR